MTPPRPALDTDGPVRLRRLAEVADLTTLQGELGTLYVRFSEGPEKDTGSASVDKESGCRLPGLSANPLSPEPWWDRPVEHWVARQLCQYFYLHGEGRFAWVLTGRLVGRGPDCEPLLDDVRALAFVEDEVLTEAQALYEEAFRPGRT